MLLFYFKKIFFKTELAPQTELEIKLEQCAEEHRAGNYHIAYNLASELAEAGNAQAQYNLAGYFENGFYVDKNREVALKFFKQSASNGFSPAIEKIKIIELNFEAYMKN